MEAAQGSLTDIRELKTEISCLRTELNRFNERSNQQHTVAVLDDLKNNYAEMFTNHQIDAATSDLSAHMVGDCAMRENCFEIFMDFLKNTARHIKDGEVSDEIIQSYREQMKTMRKKGPYEQCDTCFSEVRRLFEKQIDLMQSLGIYQKIEDGGEPVAEIPDDVVVKGILEPIASAQRFQILKYLIIQSRTFSDISQMTGLRGGNLLFHIRKLTDSGMILQRHERSDYVITAKGYKTVTAVSELYKQLYPHNIP